MSIDWDIDSYRSEFETDEHWELKKRFMLTHKDKFPEDELVCLAQVFTNIEFMGCRYPDQTMARVAQLAKGVVEDFREKKKNTLKRTFVAASDAASARVKGSTSKLFFSGLKKAQEVNPDSGGTDLKHSDTSVKESLYKVNQINFVKPVAEHTTDSNKCVTENLKEAEHIKPDQLEKTDLKHLNTSIKENLYKFKPIKFVKPVATDTTSSNKCVKENLKEAEHIKPVQLKKTDLKHPNTSVKENLNKIKRKKFVKPVATDTTSLNKCVTESLKEAEHIKPVQLEKTDLTDSNKPLTENLWKGECTEPSEPKRTELSDLNKPITERLNEAKNINPNESIETNPTALNNSVTKKPRVPKSKKKCVVIKLTKAEKKKIKKLAKKRKRLRRKERKHLNERDKSVTGEPSQQNNVTQPTAAKKSEPENFYEDTFIISEVEPQKPDPTGLNESITENLSQVECAEAVEPKKTDSTELNKSNKVKVAKAKKEKKNVKNENQEKKKKDKNRGPEPVTILYPDGNTYLQRLSVFQNLNPLERLIYLQQWLYYEQSGETWNRPSSYDDSLTNIGLREMIHLPRLDTSTNWLGGGGGGVTSWKEWREANYKPLGKNFKVTEKKLEDFVVMYERKRGSPCSVLWASADANRWHIDLVFQKPPHDNLHICQIYINGHLFERSEAVSKKVSKKKAAEEALKKLQENCYGVFIKTAHKTEAHVTFADFEEKISLFKNKNNPTLVNKGNIGAKLMYQMGWRGGGLGKLEQGMREPITPQEVQRGKGLGCGLEGDSLKEFRKKARVLIKTWKNIDFSEDLVFSPEFTEEQRKELHTIAQRLDLKSKSHGKKAKRRVIISKKKSPLTIVEELKKIGGSNDKYVLIHPKNHHVLQDLKNQDKEQELKNRAKQELMNKSGQQEQKVESEQREQKNEVDEQEQKSQSDQLEKNESNEQEQKNESEQQEQKNESKQQEQKNEADQQEEKSQSKQQEQKNESKQQEQKDEADQQEQKSESDLKECSSHDDDDNDDNDDDDDE